VTTTALQVDILSLTKRSLHKMFQQTLTVYRCYSNVAECRLLLASALGGSACVRDANACTSGESSRGAHVRTTFVTRRYQDLCMPSPASLWGQWVRHKACRFPHIRLVTAAVAVSWLTVIAYTVFYHTPPPVRSEDPRLPHTTLLRPSDKLIKHLHSYSDSERDSANYPPHVLNVATPLCGDVAAAVAATR